MIPKGKARQRLAWRIDALQFRQRSMNMGEQALVSIVMPTYKLEYFEGPPGRSAQAEQPAGVADPSVRRQELGAYRADFRTLAMVE